MQGANKTRNYQAVKSPATIDEQLDKLIERGCIVKDREFAYHTLLNINYYRLVHYFTPFLIDKHHYRPGTEFVTVLSLYDFDRRFRNEILNLLEEIEISLRAVISNFHALKYGALGYLNPSSFDRTHNHKQFLSKIDRMVEQNNDRELVAHHINKYGGAFPLWVMMELFSFGSLAVFYSDLQQGDKKEIAEESYGISMRQLDSWIACLADLRNRCAHYNRLYANTLNITPRSPTFPENTPSFEVNTSLFSYILIMKYTYRRHDSWNWEFIPTLRKLFDDYEMVDPTQYGFPNNWEEILYWQAK